MKPANFPGRKLKRKLRADLFKEGIKSLTQEHVEQIKQATQRKSKKLISMTGVRKSK